MSRPVGGRAPRAIVAFVLALMAAGLAARPALAEIAIGEEKKLKFYGDVRFRVESDWSSTNPDGTERDDRDRLRLRLRLGFSFALDEHYSFGGRIRSGFSQDQQSPHQTLGDQFETKEVNIDRAFVQGTWKHGWVWAGKNSFTFLVQDELFWDDDVTPEGVAMGFPTNLGQSKWKLRPLLGYFIMEATGSSNGFDQKADVGVVQLHLDAGLEPADLTFGSGFYMFRDNEQTLDVTLEDLDYSIVALGAKATFKNASLPWSLGVDYMENIEDYPDTLFNEDQTTGYVLGASLGSLKEKSDWLLAYYYAHIEKYAVVARLAQDDWLRWGSGIDTRASNFEGHEFRVAYAFRSAFNAMLRVYMVDGIEPETPAAVEEEDGVRARLDLNMSF